MKDFFTFYTDIKDMAVPFTAFSLYHMLFLAVSAVGIAVLFSYYRRQDAVIQRRMQVIMAVYFLVEEFCFAMIMYGIRFCLWNYAPCAFI